MSAEASPFSKKLRDLGEAGRAIAAHDWSATPLGSIEGWGPAVRSAVGTMLASPFPMVLAWGPQLITIHNDPYRPLLGTKADALGRPFLDLWAEARDVIAPLLGRALEGEASRFEDAPFTLLRRGGPEQAFFDFAFSPVRDEHGAVVGILNAALETTERVLSERRQAFRLALADTLRDIADPAEVVGAASEALARHLGVAQAAYAEVEPGGETVVIEREWNDGSMARNRRRHRLADYGPDLIAALRRGETIAIPDIRLDPRTSSPRALAAFGEARILGLLNVPVVKAGRLAAILGVHSYTPRAWSAEDIALAQDVAERTWDASERARAEAGLRESEARRGTALSAARLGTFEWDLRTDAVALDRRSREIFGFRDGEGAHADEVFGRVHPDDARRVREAACNSVAVLSRLDVEYRIRLPDGAERTVASLSDVTPGPDGRAEKAVGVFADVSEGRAAAAALERREEQLRLATEAAEVGLWDAEPTTGAMYWQARVKAMFGISPDAPVSLDDFYAGVHPDDFAEVSKAFAAACDPERQALYDVEYRTIGRDDRLIRWVAAKGRGLFEGGRCTRVLGTAIDITRRKADEARLRELNEELERRVQEALAERQLLASVIENARVFVQIVDLDYRWLAINRAAADEFSRIYGVPRPRVGGSMLEPLEHMPEHRDAVRAVWARALAGEEFLEVGPFGDPARDRRHYEMRFHSLRDGGGKLIGAYQFVHDVTERVREQARLQQAEARLQQSQKMEAMGQLTGGIAHDFNNILQGVGGTLDLIRRKPGEAERVGRWAEAALQATERGAKLTGQLLTFSRLQKLETAPVVLPELAEGMREMLERTLGPLVRVTLELEDPGAAVLSDPTQLELAILNLAINARDAMPGGGELLVRTRKVALDRDPDLAPGDYVILEVSDTGEGMPPEVAARAFEPFYTTKPVGKGTGLGLSQVYGIARQSQGIARIISDPGRGTTVRLVLRRTEHPVGARDGEVERRAQASAPQPRASVLVVDDDPDVRRFLADSLEVLGYTVHAAADGEAGLLLLDQLRPDVLVLDYAMPGMTGAEMAQVARERRPGIPIVFASGYSDTDAIEAAVGPQAAVLRKPFRVDQLDRTVAGALLGT